MQPSIGCILPPLIENIFFISLVNYKSYLYCYPIDNTRTVVRLKKRSASLATRANKGIEMKSGNVAPIRLDASKATQQIGELIDLFKLETRSFECVSQHGVELFCDNILALLNCIVLCDCSAAIRTGDIDEVVLKVEIVGALDEFASAIRAGEFHLD